jgi:hypothetical protein
MPNWKKLITSGSDAALNSLNVSTSLTASGLIYPTSDNGEESFIQTDGSGNLSLQYVKTIYEEVVNGESTNLIKGTPVYISGSIGVAGVAYRADAGDPLKMPVVYVIADTIEPAETGRGIALGLITGVDTTGFPAGTEIYVAVGGGFTSTRPTGSAIVQVLGYVTKEGAGGMGVVLNPGPNSLPNIQSGYVWVGDSNSYPIAIPSSSIQNVVSASFALTASYALNSDGGNLFIANEGIIQGTASYFDFIGEGVTATVLNNTASITIEKVVTGSTSFLDQTTPATTWSFNHNLNSKYVSFEVFDDNDFVIIPANIRVLNTNNAEIFFSSPTTGKAVAQFSGIDGAVNALTASFALTAVSASYAETASFVGFNHIQTSSSSVWNITHNLNNQYPVVQVYNFDNTVILPMSISGSDVNTTIITFSFNTTGYVRII